MSKKVVIDTPEGKTKIDYDKVEVKDKHEEKITSDMVESYNLQKDGWIVVNMYRENNVKYHVLIKNK